MDTMNDSKYHMMRGMIALAWADGQLATAERVLVERFIDNNRHLSQEQRDALKASIATQISIADVWDHITDVQDRARLIDVAGAIFHADGDYSASEKSVYADMLSLHLASMNKNATPRDVQSFTQKAQVEAKKTEAEYAAEVKKDPAKAAPSKMGLMFYRINKALGN